MTRPLEDRLAGRGRRLVATLIDMVLVPALTVLLVMITGVMEDAEDYRDSMWMLNVFLLAVLSYLILNGYWLFTRGQTVGKRLMGVAIVASPSGERAAFWKLVCIRALFFPLLFVVISPVLMLLPIVDQGFVFRKNRRCVHDLAAGTSVVKV
ncbi:MAG TPA: RDD family protein [Pseudomonadales bacterium]|nr:RDD family protein [Pseudomonadales bacterium]